MKNQLLQHCINIGVLVILCPLILTIVLTACGTSYDGSRMGNADAFLMDYKIFNSTASQDLTITAGDTLHVEIVVTGGSLSYKIQKTDDTEPLYEETSVSASDEFDLEIEESGTYTITVTGKKAKGSVHFTVHSNDQ